MTDAFYPAAVNAKVAVTGTRGRAYLDEPFTRYKQEREVIDKAEHQAATLRLQKIIVHTGYACAFLPDDNGLQGIPGGLWVAIE
jgi:hypothetical protein